MLSYLRDSGFSQNLQRNEWLCDVVEVEIHDNELLDEEVLTYTSGFIASDSSPFGRSSQTSATTFLHCYS